jgi:hypothetical protein
LKGSKIESKHEYSITKEKNPIYTCSLFDIFKWWSEVGEKRWPMVATCALIIFSRPHHNGYQERVFSRGSFTDDQLRRKMKESTFEISILEALNSKKVEEYLEYFHKREFIRMNEELLKCQSVERYLEEVKKSRDNKSNSTLVIDPFDNVDENIHDTTLYELYDCFEDKKDESDYEDEYYIE